MFELSKQLRVAIELSGERQSHMARGSGVSSSTLSRFMSGKSQLSPEAVDRLTKYLNLRLVSMREWDKRDRVWQAYVDGKLTRPISQRQSDTG
jgi:transcriptional regulator with XRE-family HTH domain